MIRNVRKTQYKKKMRKTRGKSTKMVTNRKRTYRVPSSLPFPRIKSCTLVFKQPTIPLTSSAINGTILTRFRLNSLYDFDIDNNFADKQPLYYDQLFSVTGPYKSYRVNAWKTRIVVTNLTDRAIQVYYDTGTFGSITDADTVTEIQNRPGIFYKLCTAQANASPQVIINSFKKTSQYINPRAGSDQLLTGTFQTDPTSQIVGTILMSNNDPSSLTTFSATISVEHTFYCTLYNLDGINS